MILGRATVLLALSILALRSATAADAGPDGAAPGRFDRVVSERLRLTSYSLQSIEPVADRGGRVLRLRADGREVTLRLRPESVRAPGFRVMVQDAGGALRPVAPPAPETWRGVVEGVPGSDAVASIRDGLVHALFRAPGGPEYWIQPVRGLEAGADAGAGPLHVVYRADAAPATGTCPVLAPARDARGSPGLAAADTLFADTLHADVAFDIDYEYFVIMGASVDATVFDLETTFAALRVIYERDCAIRHQITTIVVRTSPDDPYATMAPDSVLREFRNHWNATYAGVPRDLAHLITGRDLTGTTIGIAYLGAVCDLSRAYGVSQSRFATGPFSRRVALTAHEIGHNWNAVHCDVAPNVSDPCTIMCSSLGSCNGLGLPNFEPQGAADIRAFAEGRSCVISAPLAADPRRGDDGVRLEAPRPSPSAGSTRIEYTLAAAGPARITVHDVGGRRRAVVVDRVEGAGPHAAVWDGRGDDGVAAPPGVWYVRLEAGGVSRARRIVLIR